MHLGVCYQLPMWSHGSSRWPPVASDSQLPANMAQAKSDDVSVAQSQPSPHPSCRRRNGRQRVGGRDDKRIYHSCLQWLRPTVLHCMPELGIHVKIAPFLWLPSLVGETKACLVLQMHPVKSAASSTAQPKSCFAHAHLALWYPHDRHFNWGASCDCRPFGISCEERNWAKKQQFPFHTGNQQCPWQSFARTAVQV